VYQDYAKKIFILLQFFKIAKKHKRPNFIFLSELKPKIVVSNVDPAHTPEDFMTMLYNNNFVD